MLALPEERLQIKLWWEMFRKGKKRHSSSSSQSSEISTKSKVGGGAETAVITVRTVSSERRCMKGTKHGRPADILQTGGVYILFFLHKIHPAFDLI